MSPCESSAAVRMSPCAVRVGSPVDGPTRWMSKTTPGHLGVVRQAGELAHQRDAGAGGRRHRPRARPAGADHHADRRDLVLGLDDREGRLAGLLVDAVLLHVADQRLGQRRRRRDRIPGDDGDAGHHAAERGGGVAFDQDLAGGLVHPLDAERILLGEVLARRSRSRPSSAPRFSSTAFAFLPSCLRSAFSISARSMSSSLREHAVVDHVLDEAAQLGVGADRRRRSCRTAPDRTTRSLRSALSFSGSS